MHKRIVNGKVKTNQCICGKSFKSAAKIGRHVQKWNTKHDLRDK